MCALGPTGFTTRKIFCRKLLRTWWRSSRNTIDSRSFTDWALGIARNKLKLHYRQTATGKRVMGNLAMSKIAEAMGEVSEDSSEIAEALGQMPQDGGLALAGTVESSLRQ